MAEPQIPYRALPQPNTLETVKTEHYFRALENFAKVFAVREGEKMVMLTDRLLDPRVPAAISGLARSRGVKPWIVQADSSQLTAVPEEVKPILSQADFVVSSWFCSIIDPYCIALRRDHGQRWVKITYFRNLDLLHTAQAAFPIELVGEITRATAARYPKGRDFALAFQDQRGTDFRIPFTAEMRENLLKSNRWRGQTTAAEPGAYVHYLPTHGPNVYDRTSVKDDPAVMVPMEGTVYATWAVGFPKPFDEKIGVRFAQDRIVEVTGNSADAGILRDMLMGGQLIELGCGFNPKAPRHTVYPAGSNSPGALHFGIDLAKPCDYIRRTMPDWEEPPVHMDLIAYDMTLTAGNTPLITDGFLEALRDDNVVAMARRYGDPVDLLEAWPE